MTPVSKLVGIIIPAILAFSSPVWAKSSGFCLECHSSLSLDNFAKSVSVEERNVYQARMEPCPGIRSLSEEAFFTEGRIVKIGEILKRMEQEGWSTELLRKGNGQGADAFSRFQTQEIQSLGEYARKSSAVRSGLQKVYDQTLQKRAESSRRWLIGIGVLVFLTLMFLLGWGIIKLNRMGKVLSVTLLWGAALFSSACSSTPADLSKKNPIQEKLEESLSLARQVSARAEEGGVQSVLLSQMAGDWSWIDPSGSAQGFDLAWKMALKNREQAAQIQTLQGVLAPWPDAAEARKKNVKFDTVLDLRDEIRNSEVFIWPLRSVAEEWVRARDKKGIAALEWISQKIPLINDPEVRDRELKSLAEIWAQVDEGKAWEVCRTISDPFLRASALGNLALFTRNEDRAGNLVREAWKAGQALTLPFARCKVLARIGAAGGRVLPREKKFWAGQVEAEIQRIKDPALRSMALQEAVYAWAPLDRAQAEHWTAAIPAPFAERRAYSYLFLSRRDGTPRSESLALLKKAWAEADRIEDVFQLQKIKSLIGKTLARVAPEDALRALPEIEDPFYRSEVLREAVERVEDREQARILAEKIPLENFRYRAGIRIIDRGGQKDWDKVHAFEREALTAAQSIADPYVRAKALIEVALEGQRSEIPTVDQVFELALKSAGQIASPSLKAEILELSGDAWKTVDSARRPSILDQVDPSLTGTRRKLEEIRLWAKTDPAKARQMADQIPSDFPHERLSAYKEVLSGLRKSRNSGMNEVFALAWQQALDLPPEQGRAKFLSELSAEADVSDGERAILRLKRLPDLNLRDSLLKETGLMDARENPAQALQIAREISESSARTAVYRKISDSCAQNPGRMKGKGTESSFIPMLISWGLAREKARRGELEAVPFFERALGELEMLPESTERSYLFSALATDWAAIDEKKALKVAEKISGENLVEPFSYALLAIANQYKKWSRREAESLFQKTVSETEKISDPYLRVQRMFQIAKEWRVINRRAAKETLARAEEEVRRLTLGEKEPTLLVTVLMEGVAWEPETTLEISRKAGAPAGVSKILLEGARTLRERTLDRDRKYLERALQWAQREKNFPLMGEVAAAWYKLNPLKAVEILGQIEARDVRVQTLRRIAEGAKTTEERVRLLDRAAEEVTAVGGLTLKIQLLKGIAKDMAHLDKDRAKSLYLKAYRILDREYRSYP